MMYILRYPVELHEKDDGFTVTFPDMPYGVSYGYSKSEALLNAADCLEEIVASLIHDKKDIPQPSPAHRRPTITLPSIISAKVLLYRAFLIR